LEDEGASLVNRNHWHLERLISASTVPFLRDPVDRFGMFERVVAFRIIDVDGLPRRQDEDLRKISVAREPVLQLAVAQRRDAIEPAQGIDNTSLKENRYLACGVMNEILDVLLQDLPREHIRIWSRS